MFETVIFDWDGTLADTRKVVVASFQRALHESKIEISDGFIEQRIGIGTAETFKEILFFSRSSFDRALIKALVEKKIQNEIELSTEVELFDGSKQLLELLHERTKLGLASMNDRKVIDHMLRITSMNRFFKAVFTAEDVNNPKPHPEVFLKCATKLGSQPEECVVVEDSLFGVEAAKTAKMKCIAVLTGVHSEDMLGKANPDLIVGSLKERSKILNFIFN
jgi:HAD superfamily hydrolase (TIGR01509 family)